MLLCPWDFLGKSTGVGCHFLLQRIFPTQESNPGLLHCRQTLYHLSHQGIATGWIILCCGGCPVHCQPSQIGQPNVSRPPCLILSTSLPKSSDFQICLQYKAVCSSLVGYLSHVSTPVMPGIHICSVRLMSELIKLK